MVSKSLPSPEQTTGRHGHVPHCISMRGSEWFACARLPFDFIICDRLLPLSVCESMSGSRYFYRLHCPQRPRTDEARWSSVSMLAWQILSVVTTQVEKAKPQHLAVDIRYSRKVPRTKLASTNCILKWVWKSALQHSGLLSSSSSYFSLSLPLFRLSLFFFLLYLSFSSVLLVPDPNFFACFLSWIASFCNFFPPLYARSLLLLSLSIYICTPPLTFPP